MIVENKIGHVIAGACPRCAAGVVGIEIVVKRDSSSLRFGSNQRTVAMIIGVGAASLISDHCTVTLLAMPVIERFSSLPQDAET